MTDAYTAALLTTKPSLDDYSRFWHGFETEASLPLTQKYLTTPPDFVGLTSLSISTLMQLEFYHGFFMYFLLSDGESLGLVKNTKVELVMKPRHPTSIGNTLVIQPFLTHCSHRFSYFSNLR